VDAVLLPRHGAVITPPAPSSRFRSPSINSTIKPGWLSQGKSGSIGGVDKDTEVKEAASGRAKSMGAGWVVNNSAGTTIFGVVLLVFDFSIVDFGVRKIRIILTPRLGYISQQPPQ
jgi:hypothetical protein